MGRLSGFLLRKVTVNPFSKVHLLTSEHWRAPDHGWSCGMTPNQRAAPTAGGPMALLSLSRASDDLSGVF